MNQRAVRTSENGVLLRPASLEEAGGHGHVEGVHADAHEAVAHRLEAKPRDVLEPRVGPEVGVVEVLAESHGVPPRMLP